MGREAFEIGRIQWISHEEEAHGFVLGFVASSAGASGPVQESKLTSERPREDGAVSATFG